MRRQEEESALVVRGDWGRASVRGEEAATRQQPEEARRAVKGDRGGGDGGERTSGDANSAFGEDGGSDESDFTEGLPM
ncbi:hypothetical protein E2562_006438 [Oryza meyeriana var. granulata]|uniref:DUF834 domain-containing protein n=1 Tax=Oryza meyeriana var. granulata TaxID=110450 RepID=A0A6G1CPQ8_9ORYZ|nr:hypothetical protein E2562_006438 [Oryza meyeriana var. granulata]